RTRGDLPRRLWPAGNRRRIDADWARVAWIKIARSGRIENISPIANSDSRWSLRRRERVAARFEQLPKRQIKSTRVARELLCCHSKWKSLELNFFLPALECFVNKSVDFFHCIICHRVTTNGSTAAVYHKKAAGSSKRTIIGVGKTGIERQIFARI